MQRGIVSRFALFAAMLGCAASCLAQTTKSPALSKQRYDSIVSNLDTGGDLLIVANMEGYIKDFVDGVTKPLLAATGANAESRAIRTSISKLPDFLDKNGFYALQGFGASVVPRVDGLNTLKCFVARNPAAASAPLWCAMAGRDPKTLACADFLPADTVLARTCTSELKQLWKIIRSGVTELGTPEAAASFNLELSNMATNSGVDLDKVFDSFAGEGFFSIQLSKTSTVELPVSGPEAPLKVPQPTLLACLAVKDNSLVKAIETSLAKAKISVTAVEGDATIKSINLPMPLPFPVALSYTVHSNFFLFGSTPEVVACAVKAFKTKNGFTASPEFKKAFQGLPTVNNGIFYMSPRLMAAITDVQSAMMKSKGEAESGFADMMRNLIIGRDKVQSAVVFQNLKSGILVSGTTASGGRELVGNAMIAPIGLMAAIAIPSFVNARNAARGNACINNLRMLDAAKEQWAMAKNKTDGAEVSVKEMVQYLKGGKLPVCPQGGVYSVGPIGKDPECSIPAHNLHSRLP